MKARHLFIATALAALAGCSQGDELLAGDNSLQNKQQEEITYVDFSSYNSRQTTTRNGYVGNITDTELKASDKAYGFGVFAFFTGTVDYGDASMDKKYPNFMYNEHIYWNDAFATANKNSWKYDVLKPWPNGEATSGDQAYGSKVSFFAYAPYVAEGSGTDGITALSAKDNEGNPFVTYSLPSDGKFVDLLWGTCPETKKYELTDGSQQDMSSSNYGGSAYPVNINLKKQKTGEKVSFLFKHALAKIGGGTTTSTGGTEVQSGLMVQLDIDNNGAITGGTKPDYQKVTIRDIEIKCSKQVEGASGSETEAALKTKGDLDLATGKWTNLAAETTPKVIDLRLTSPATATAGTTADIRTDIAEPTGVSYDETGWNTLPTGVTTTPQNVFGVSAEAPAIVLFPGTKPVIEITVDYVVRTKDPKLKDYFSETKQKITKTVSFPQPLEMNKKYNIIMHIGLTNIKFDATVESWDDYTPGGDTNGDGTTDDQDKHIPVGIPLNVK